MYIYQVETETIRSYAYLRTRNDGGRSRRCRCAYCVQSIDETVAVVKAVHIVLVLTTAFAFRNDYRAEVAGNAGSSGRVVVGQNVAQHVRNSEDRCNHVHTVRYTHHKHKRISRRIARTRFRYCNGVLACSCVVKQISALREADVRRDISWRRRRACRA